MESLRNSHYQSYVEDEEGGDCCDLYLRLENLEADIQKLESQLEFRLPPIGKINQSRRKLDWRGYYSDADATLVSQICAADILRLGYRFDP